MEDKLSSLIVNKNIKTISIIGMAKNTGKTVTLNQLIEELYLKGYKLGLLSYGRDGESIDLITGKKKPPVKVYPGSFFVTASRALKGSDLHFKKIAETDISSTMGQVNLYQAQGEGEVQLVGINRLSQLMYIKDQLINRVDYLLIDGALDRRSSALPRISGAVVLATGAVIGKDLDDVMTKTKYEVQKLNMPTLNNQDDLIYIQKFEQDKESILWTAEDEIVRFKTPTSLLLLNEIKDYLTQSKKSVKYIFVNGAFTNTISRRIIDLNLNDLTVIIPDATKLFIDKMEYARLVKNNISLKVLYPLNLIALTINPYNPEGQSLDDDEFLDNIKRHFDIPVFNVKSREY
jgi:GTPase SAR1 family protein